MDIALVCVVIARLVVPLAIPRWPLPSIVLALVIDAADQTVLVAFDSIPDDYQGYDKALDVYYLAVAYISTLRNWLDGPAFRLARLLWYYRLVGVALFEFTGARTVLLVFPNTFEYFFILYEVIRTRWDPQRIGQRVWWQAAAAIWICIKLPQEWWIHWAQLDVTMMLKQHNIASLAVIGVSLAVAGIASRFTPPVPRADWAWDMRVDNHPTTVLKRAADRVTHSWSPLLRPAAEKLLLVGLVTAIFSQIIPRSDLPVFDIVLGVVLVVGASSWIGSFVGRGGTTWMHAAIDFAVTGLVNLVIVFVVVALPTDPLDGGIGIVLAVFLVGLLTLIVALYDRYRALRLQSIADALLTEDAASATQKER